jgi:hypothetical protein
LNVEIYVVADNTRRRRALLLHTNKGEKTASVCPAFANTFVSGGSSVREMKKINLGKKCSGFFVGGKL